MRAFQEELRWHPWSIDSFLENRPDPELREVGMAMVAAQIMACESHQMLTHPRDDDHWYPTLLGKLCRKGEDLAECQAAIITFNYDRSFEEFLHRTLCKSFGLNQDAAADQVRAVPIVHVYGHVGSLDWQGGEESARYSSGISADRIRSAIESLRVISEGRDDSAELALARTWLAKATKVFFLGFGYHPDNMRRLGFPLADSTNRNVLGSAFRLTDAQQEVLKQQYRITHWGDRSLMSHSFLMNQTHFLSL
jgi:hypothetical protein